MNSASKEPAIPGRLPPAWYDAPIEEFILTAAETILGRLAQAGDYDLVTTQRAAWLAEIEILKSTLSNLQGHIFLEFTIPRMGRRIDAVILTVGVILVVEFKIGESEYSRTDIEQVWDYALDLKNFHSGSHSAVIVPILVVTDAPGNSSLRIEGDEDGVYRPIALSAPSLNKTILHLVQSIAGELPSPQTWAQSPYRPTPTIIEAARALYANHSVEAIARFDAGAKNLIQTSGRIEQLVDEARESGRKIICFLTGVPGAGKTLVGLNVSTRRRTPDQDAAAVFLSGNGPLVKVLSEALTRDEWQKQKEAGKSPRKGKIAESVKAFIQNVHHFRDEALRDLGPPHEHVAIFDEAQRAWNVVQTSKFMSQKKGVADFNHSEPDFLISYLNRHKDWAVIVCLVGGGQEINTGEAGIGTWIEALRENYPDWEMHISPELTDSEYSAGHALEQIKDRTNTHFDKSLHLSVSMRSFRAENVSAFVKALLDCELRDASEALEKFRKRYPLAVTRDLTLAKAWIRSHARGSERFGMVASARAQRLKPHAIDVRVPVDPVKWFLNGKEDTRSSYYLEDAATEYRVQGLELDWVCVTWDGDLRFAGDRWSYHSFRGHCWRNVHKPEIRHYLRNAYRVLLTRARQGMVIFVPEGDAGDATRASKFYDPTFEYLAEIGIPTLE